MKSIILGLGDEGVVSRPDEELKTYALGSCVAVILIDSKFNVVGMAHVVLPESKIDLQKAQLKPGYFADAIIPVLIKKMQNRGSQGRLSAKLVGGAYTLDGIDSFQIGKRNALALKKQLWKYRIAVLAEDIGEKLSRTVTVGTDGTVTITSPKRETISI
ncbi:chemotaxis protein CheD [Deltaproteobacteria bacterium TL4]